MGLYAFALLSITILIYHEHQRRRRLLPAQHSPLSVITMQSLKHQLSGETIVETYTPTRSESQMTPVSTAALCKLVNPTKLMIYLTATVVLSIQGFSYFLCLGRKWMAVSSMASCTTSLLTGNLSFLDGIKPITHSEFIARRDRLAAALVESGADAFILEPGYTSQYYANFSQRDWEPWEPEERPMLMVIQPHVSNKTVSAVTTFVAPRFEISRLKMLPIPLEGRLRSIPREEQDDPYVHLRKELFRGNANLTLMIDEETRDFISRGLARAGFNTVGVSSAVEAVRQIKSDAEIKILRAVNTGTVNGVRALQKCLRSGSTENQAASALDRAMKSVGFSKFFNIVMFDEDAALPHGGYVVGNKELTSDTMVVIDVGYHYLGYSSDICRSFFVNTANESQKSLPFASGRHGFIRQGIQYPLKSALTAEKEKVWDIVFHAQTAAAEALQPHNTPAEVDFAARQVIVEAGYGNKFTHRVGHGIGIKAHESPYLFAGNNATRLKPGMVFTNEPGIYIPGQFGVRHEDIYLVKESGPPEILSGSRAQDPYNP